MELEKLVEVLAKGTSPRRSYQDAPPEIVAMAQRLIEECDELAVAADAKVKYLFVDRKWNKLGECARATGKWRFLTGFDFVITLNKEAWENMDDQSRRALLHHELSHIEKRDDKWVLRRHDIEEFFSTASRFGLWSESLKIMSQIVGEQDVEEGGR